MLTPLINQLDGEGCIFSVIIIVYIYQQKKMYICNKKKIVTFKKKKKVVVVLLERFLEEKGHLHTHLYLKENKKGFFCQLEINTCVQE